MIAVIWFDIIQMEREQPESERIVETIVVVDMDPSLSLFKPTQQKWVSSLELLGQPPKEPKTNAKTIHLAPGTFLQVAYCQKNRPPVYDIEFQAQPSPEWIVLKGPQSVNERLGGTFLCYKAGQLPSSEPLTDIQMLITERKKMNDEKEVFILPPGFKIVHNNPISHSFLISKRMRSPLQQTFKACLDQKYPQNYQGVNLAMLPLFCFPQGIHLAKDLKGFINFNFVLTTQMADKFYCNCLTFKENLSQSKKQELGLSLHDSVYSEKALCLISKHRYTDEYEECLRHLYRLSMSKNDVPFHRVIECFVSGLVMPKELGINGMSYSYGGSNINFDTNPTYPIVSERAIYCVFKFLPIQAIISVFEAILLEKKIIFVSQSKTVLGYAVEAFLAFVFPFRWEHVLIPILPSTLRQYVTAPVPLIVGISPQMLDRSIESDSIVVQLDSGTLLNDEDLPPLPDKMEKQLRKRLDLFELYDEEEVKQYLENPESTYIFKMQEVEHPEFKGFLVRDSFYEFMLTLMKNYRKFWKVQKYKDNKENSSIGLTEPQLLNDMFRLQDFLSDLGMTKVGSFGYKMTESTLFTSFIERRYQYSDDPELTFFDESLDKKKSKKDVKLIQKPANIRYNVAAHPQPQTVKQVFQYDCFPSILEKVQINESDIVVQVDSINEEELDLLEQFLEHQLRLNRRLYSESNADDIDYKIESLLTVKFRLKFEGYCQQTGKSDNIRSSIVSKFKNTRQIFDKLTYFQKIYQEQLSYIDSIFSEWPYEAVSSVKVRQVEKRDFIKDKMSEVSLENELLCVFEEYYGFKCRNYEALVMGGTRINLLGNREEGYQTSLDSARNSKKKIKCNYEIVIEHFKLKNFLNKVIGIQGHSFFAFAIRNLQQNNTAIWNIEVLLAWREELLSHSK